MHIDVSFYMFERAFHNMNRKDNFSHYGLRKLFDYFEDLEDSCDIQIELDVVVICCVYTEYDSVKELCEAYSLDFTYDEDDDEDTIADNFRDYLCEKGFTIVCCEYACIIIQAC